MVTAVLAGSLLPGCPLTDEYFVDPHAGLPGLGSGAGGTSTASGGAGGSAAIAGAAVTGGTTGGSSGATSRGGAGGASPSSGGSGQNGGNSGTDSAGGAPDAGGSGEGGAGTSAGGTGGGTGCASEPERCDGIDNDCNDAIDEESVCPDSCTARRSPSDGHLYLLCLSTDSGDEIAADDASARCTDLGSELGLELPFGLVWIESSEENEFLKDWIVDAAPSDGKIWTAANDQNEETIWVWGRRTGAEQFFTADPGGGGIPYMDRFNDWASGQPDARDGTAADCAVFDSNVEWQWNDQSCARQEIGYVCEEHPPF